jgi:hypothetical protein
LVLALLISAGCAESTGAEFGRVEAFLADPQNASFNGELIGNVQVSISEDGSTWFDLGSSSGVTVPLQTNVVRTTVHGEQDAPVGTYSWVRVTMSDVRARLDFGSSIGTTFLSGSAEVPLGGSDDFVEVVLQVPGFDVEASELQRRSVTFTVNSSAWMTEAALQALLVEDAPIEAAVTAVVTIELRS